MLLVERLRGYRFHIGVLYLGRNNLEGVLGISECVRRNMPRSVRILMAVSDHVLSFLILREKFSIWTGRGLKHLYDQNFEWEQCTPKEGFASPEELREVWKWALMSKEKRAALRSRAESERFLSGGMELYVDNLRLLIEEGQSRGMKFLYVRQVHLPHSFHGKYMPLIWELTDEVIGPLKVPSFDMHAHFQKVVQPKELFPGYLSDDIHLTPQGNALVAEGLIEAFRNLGWLPPR